MGRNSTARLSLPGDGVGGDPWPMAGLEPGDMEEEKNQTEMGPLSPGTPPRGAGTVHLRSFVWMSIWFSLNHGAVMGALALASSVLGTDLGGTGSGTLYLVYTCTALILASGVNQRLGPKVTLVVGLILYTGYLACFLLAVLCGDTCAWVVFNGGSALGGFAAGIYWIAQGSYFALCARAYAEARGETFGTATSYFSGIFAFIYLALEVVAKLGSYAVLEAYGEDNSSKAHALIFSIYTAAAAVSAAGMYFVPEAPGVEERRGGNWGDKALSAIRLLILDPRMRYLAPTNITFGFVSSFSTNVVNAKIIKEYMGESAVPLVSAMLSGIAAAAAMPLGRLGNITGTKAPSMLIGLGMLAAECAVYLAFSEEQLGTWAIITMLTVAQGLGRAMWEGVNRGITADFFDGEQREAAFANIVLQMGTASTIGFYSFPPLLDAHGKAPLAIVCLASAVIAIVCFPLALRAHEARGEAIPVRI